MVHSRMNASAFLRAAVNTVHRQTQSFLEQMMPLPSLEESSMPGSRAVRLS